MDEKNRIALRDFLIFLIALISLLVLAGYIVVFAQTFVNKCIWWDCAPKRNFTVFDLDIPKGYLPNNASIRVTSDRGIIDAIEEGHGSYIWINGNVSYKVLKFATEKQAVQWFESGPKPYSFDPSIPGQGNTVYIRDILDYVAVYANQYKITCGFLAKDLRCVFEARYIEFYTYFSSSIGEDKLSNHEYIGILNFLDARLGHLLDLQN